MSAQEWPTIGPRDWYFTFGFAHHANSGESLAHRYVHIHGTFDEAREEMMRRFGHNWGFQYPSAEAAGVGEFGLREFTTTERA